MRAMLTTAHGDRSVLKLDEHFADPEPKEGEVVVEVKAASLNYHDIFTRRGMPGIRIQLPIIVGSDIAGIVSEVGEGVDESWLTKRVLIDPVFRDGKRFGMIGETVHGGRAELVAVQANQLLELPDGVSFEQAGALPLAYGTAWRMMVTQGQVKAGETVLVLGASGGVGVGWVAIGKLFGADVMACAGSRSKLERLGELGADQVVNYAETNFREAVWELAGKPRVNGQGGVDMAINFTGGDTMIDTQRSVRAGGRILTCGATAGYDLQIDARYWWTFEQHMIGANGWTASDLHELLTRIDGGQLDPVIDEVMPLEATAEAERMLEDREVFGKIVLRP
ncbi:MAG: zinc-binding dehydrogenase [Actinomycetia bacterium]|nr:zinc-binding dehydrogenase [Actinomycetes bacterium]